MSFSDIQTKLRSDNGFTIIELLIVIVVIGILAAITIVSFNGVTNKANTTSAQSSAEAVIKKSEAYNAEKGHYPTAFTDLTDSPTTQSDSFFLTGVSSTSGVANPTSANGKTTVLFLKCASSTAASQAAITTSNITGISVGYYNFSTPGVVFQSTGVATSCPTNAT